MKIWKKCGLSPIILFFVPFVITIALGFPTNAAGASAGNGGKNQQLELGFVKQMFDNSGGGRGAQWVEKFCDLALSLKGEEYVRFLKLARLEAVPVTEEDYKNRPTGASDLMGYMSSASDRIRVNQCLEHGGEMASSVVLHSVWNLSGCWRE